MKKPNMYVISLITDYFLYTRTTQVSLFACWGIIIIYITTAATTTTTITVVIAAATAGICEIH